jgi:uncharacterized protein YecE (DUF72 family)
MPPKFDDAKKALRFAEDTGLGERFALELRNKELLGNDKLCSELMEKVTLVSIDSPDYQNRLFPGKIVYLRMHGRESWYSYNYSQKEIEETLLRLNESGPERVYIYFNNDHNMLNNARMALETLSDT